MSALIALLLVAADPTPPPAIEVPEGPEPRIEVKKPDWVSQARDAPAPGDAPEWNLAAQVSVTAVQSLNGIYLGIAACGALYCYGSSAMPLVFGVAGAGAGFAISLLDGELARGWGRATLVNSITVAGGLAAAVLATRPELSLGQQAGYSLMFLTDVVLTAGAMVLVKYVSPRPEAVWLANSLGLWGILLGDSAASLVRGDRSLFMIGGALAGAATGALMGASAQRMSLWRVVIANATAMLGALILGGGLAIYESLAATPQRPYDPAVPTAGVAAGIAGGFLVGFMVSEPL